MNEEVISIAEAKKHFSELIGKIAHGKKQVLITKRGKPMARIIPADQPVRHLGDAKGWLDADDPFFSEIDHIIQSRNNHIPRLIKKDEK